MDAVGTIMTVLGPIAPTTLGVTLPHEHIFYDAARALYTPPEESIERARAEGPITLENLWWIRERPLMHRGNLVLDEEDVALREVGYFRAAGGNAIVDCTIRGIHPDPVALAQLSRRSGVQIVLGTGYYVAKTHPPELDQKSVDEVADELVRDLTEGFGQTGIRAGLIGEIGVGGIPHFAGIASFDEVAPTELKVLRAAARAHRRTGVAISVHPPRSRVPGLPRSRMAFGVLDLLEEEGVSLDRVIICHLDSSWDEEVQYHREIARRGAYVEYDVWGWNDLYWPARRDGFLHDARRVELVQGMIQAGFTERLLLAHDICTKHRLRAYGGHGFDYLLRFGVEMLLANGVSRADLRTIFVENPARLLTITAPVERSAPASPLGRPLGV